MTLQMQVCCFVCEKKCDDCLKKPTLGFKLMKSDFCEENYHGNHQRDSEGGKTK
jgi:hypothetical protein